jgi:crossover junction endodeoxyribonuclease RuvC
MGDDCPRFRRVSVVGESPGSHGGALIVIGIDPGTRFTGYGVVRKEGNKLTRLASGRIVAGTSANALGDRLVKIHNGLDEVLRTWSPDQSALEGIFTARNAMSSLKLGHARGVAMLAMHLHDVPLTEYAPASIKQAVTGNGRAKKDTVEQMVRMMLSLRDMKLSEDEADALAIAICHCNTSGFHARLR